MKEGRQASRKKRARDGKKEHKEGRCGHVLAHFSCLGVEWSGARHADGRAKHKHTHTHKTISGVRSLRRRRIPGPSAPFFRRAVLSLQSFATGGEGRVNIVRVRVRVRVRLKVRIRMRLRLRLMVRFRVRMKVRVRVKVWVK